VSNTILPVEVSYAHRSSVILALAKGDLTPGPLWQKRDYRLKFFLRTLLFWSSTTRMLETISRRDDFSTLLKAQPTLPVKTQRQYLTRGMTASERAEAILHHYAWIDALPDNGLAHPLPARRRLPCCSLRPKRRRAIRSMPPLRLRLNARAKPRSGYVPGITLCWRV